jgi:RNA polymerase sigma-70 factor (ECF subfamily)
MTARGPACESDGQLMGRVQHDDADAFACLYERYAARAFGVAYSVCHDRTRAEDAVQEGFLGIWRGRRAYTERSGSFASWAMVIVRHRAIDIGRHDSARPRPSTQPPDAAVRADQGSASPADTLIARENADELRASLRQIPEAQAEVIALAFFGELSHAEIAERLSLPAGTVKGRMRLGLKKLRADLALSGRSSRDDSAST